MSAAKPALVVLREERADSTFLVIRDEDRSRKLAEVMVPDDGPDKETLADFDLFAAAPDLLALLNEAFALMPTSGSPARQNWLTRAEAAIGKARGGGK